MNSRLIPTLIILVALLTALSGCGEKPSPAAAGIPEPAPQAIPEVSEVTLQVMSEAGPGKLFVKFVPGTAPSAKSLQPDWEALRGPFTPTENKGEFSAEVDIGMKTLSGWDHPPTDKTSLWTWPDRFGKPVKLTIPSLKLPGKKFPLTLRLDQLMRIRQDPLTYPIDKLKSLLVINTEYVNDPTRTWDPVPKVQNASGPPPPPTGNRNGVWTFHHLVSCIANTPETGVSPPVLVGRWLDTWANPQQPEGLGGNGTPPGNVAPVRNGAGWADLIAHWPRLPGSTAGPGTTADLDTAQAPFRLLAIVNRFDLRESTLYGGGSKAELRFVFCAVDTDGSDAGDARDFLVIFEFGVPLLTSSAVHKYARQWAELSRQNLTTAVYLQELEAITESVVKPVAGSTRPNRSNLNQIRTEELHFGQTPWEFREFIIDSNTSNLNLNLHKLKTNTLAKTPDSWVKQRPVGLCRWINSSINDVMSGNYTLPEEMGETFDASGLALTRKRLRGAMAQSGGTTNWLAISTEPCNEPARRGFIFNTCNGCHSKDGCRQTGSDFSFMTHLSKRPYNKPSETSDFLFTFDPPPDLPPTNRPDDLDQRLDKLQRAAEFSPALPLDEIFLRRVLQTH